MMNPTASRPSNMDVPCPALSAAVFRSDSRGSESEGSKDASSSNNDGKGNLGSPSPERPTKAAWVTVLAVLGGISGIECDLEGEGRYGQSCADSHKITAHLFDPASFIASLNENAKQKEVFETWETGQFSYLTKAALDPSAKSSTTIAPVTQPPSTEVITDPKITTNSLTLNRELLLRGVIPDQMGKVTFTD